MGLLSTAAKVAVASSIHGRVQRRQQQRWAAQDAAAAADAVGAPETMPMAPFPAAGPVPAPPAAVAPPAGAPPAGPFPAAAAPVVAAPVVAEPEDPMISQLRQLASLRDAGILTEDEFAAKKAQILGI